ncbi:MAG: hypothetical protein EZS28_030653, partial [Streblomastix strix]
MEDGNSQKDPLADDVDDTQQEKMDKFIKREERRQKQLKRLEDRRAKITRMFSVLPSAHPGRSGAPSIQKDRNKIINNDPSLYSINSTQTSPLSSHTSRSPPLISNRL